MKTTNGVMCGGVVSQSTFRSDPWAYMMCYVMPDKFYEKYVKAVDEKDDKKRKELFKKHAQSMV